MGSVLVLFGEKILVILVVGWVRYQRPGASSGVVCLAVVTREPDLEHFGEFVALYLVCLS